MNEGFTLNKRNPPCAESCYTVENLRGHLDCALDENKQLKERLEIAVAALNKILKTQYMLDIDNICDKALKQITPEIKGHK